MCVIILFIIRSNFILTGTLSKSLVPLSKHQETRCLLLLGVGGGGSQTQTSKGMSR